MLLASQLPENPADAQLVVQAIAELVQTFMAEKPPKKPQKVSNVLPFAKRSAWRSHLSRRP